MAPPSENDGKKDPGHKHWLTPLDVIALFVVLLWLSAYILTHPLFTSSTNVRAKVTIAQIGAFSNALHMFKLENGSYPSGTNGLNDLVVKPTNATTEWHQYLDRIPFDPWGHPYLYVFPGQHDTNYYDLSSDGPDGIPGTKDDIYWQTNK